VLLAPRCGWSDPVGRRSPCQFSGAPQDDVILMGKPHGFAREAARTDNESLNRASIPRQHTVQFAHDFAPGRIREGNSSEDCLTPPLRVVIMIQRMPYVVVITHNRSAQSAATCGVMRKEIASGRQRPSLRYRAS